MFFMQIPVFVFEGFDFLNRVYYHRFRKLKMNFMLSKMHPLWDSEYHGGGVGDADTAGKT